ncbi:endonuclease/exonuclease/phosphatase family protein [Chryseobacterium balustinum]|uniref:Endonuclease/Exonuclease/phosphatase family protein n=1 Tax=Chryseobacterium balustinum TaxID=246 RepID=A0ABY1LEW5_9FLAO|nr:endonuclease/exonuclease/phosphatase family protein [Chryseobacterium balustinum]AZB32122.1 endonuclease/exonuclease/phosphatase family protein [Chryseobacterium balustinum]SKB93970.1 Endonuclease/Exonuclease/phosphatase family protein [Chryseobacterium balustinum]
MKIATWNLQRLDKRTNNLILEKLVEIDADILILTETNTAIQLDNYNCISTELLPTDFDGIKYKGGEIRVSILTKYNIAARHDTFDKFTTVCTDLETPFGLLTIYGSIIGVFGNRQPRFDSDLNGQLSDFEILFPNRQICFAGDLNTTFSGRPWPSKKAREILIDAFDRFELINTTADIVDTVDHIVLSDELLINKKLEIEIWNTQKKLSDHVGHMITLT